MCLSFFAIAKEQSKKKYNNGHEYYFSMNHFYKAVGWSSPYESDVLEVTRPHERNPQEATQKSAGFSETFEAGQCRVSDLTVEVKDSGKGTIDCQATTYRTPTYDHLQLYAVLLNDVKKPLAVVGPIDNYTHISENETSDVHVQFAFNAKHYPHIKAVRMQIRGPISFVTQ